MMIETIAKKDQIYIAAEIVVIAAMFFMIPAITNAAFAVQNPACSGNPLFRSFVCKSQKISRFCSLIFFEELQRS